MDNTGKKTELIFIISSFNENFGGGEKYILFLFKALSQFKSSIKFFGVWHNEFSSLPWDSIVYEPSCFWPQKQHPFGTHLILNGNRALYKYFFSVLKHGRFPGKVIYIHHQTFDDMARGKTLAYLRPIILFVCCRFCQNVVRVSDGCFPDLIAYGKVRTIYNGIEIDHFNGIFEEKKERFLSKEKINILSIGSLIPRKNHQACIKALKFIPNLCLTILGTGPELPFLKKLAKTINVENRVNFAGFQDDIRPFLKDADIFVSAALQEAFGLSIIEAMASGLPVIATPTTGAREILSNENLGILLPSYEVEDLVNAIKYLCENPNSTKNLSMNARMHVESHFSIDSFCAQWRKLIEEAA